MIDVGIKDGLGRSVKISPQGELFVRQLKFGESQFQSLNAIDTAFNFFKPMASERFVVTGVIINTNKDVGVNGAIVDIYEANSTTSTTIDKQLFRINILKNDSISITNILLGVTEGKFVNGKTDDAIVNITLGGYFIDV